MPMAHYSQLCAGIRSKQATSKVRDLLWEDDGFEEVENEDHGDWIVKILNTDGGEESFHRANDLVGRIERAKARFLKLAPDSKPCIFFHCYIV